MTTTTRGTANADEWRDMPPPERAHSDYDWDAIVATLQANEGLWGLLLSDVPVSLAVAIRARKMRPLRLPDGVVEVRVRNSRIHPDTGRRTGDLWMRYKKTAP